MEEGLALGHPSSPVLQQWCPWFLAFGVRLGLPPLAPLVLRPSDVPGGHPGLSWAPSSQTEHEVLSSQNLISSGGRGATPVLLCVE